MPNPHRREAERESALLFRGKIEDIGRGMLADRAP